MVLAPNDAWARRYVVNIESVPSGATVRLDSETAAPLGTTPLRAVRMESGNHVLYFSHDGYVAGRIDVRVRRSRETFSATLVQAGSIYVASDTVGARIMLDGANVGTTPGRLNNVPPGMHIVEILAEGMVPFRETVQVASGAVASVNGTLQPRQSPTGIVRVIVTNPAGPLPADLTVRWDGTPMVGVPPTVEAATPGQHILQISANGFRTIQRQVDVTAGQTIALAIDLEANVVVPTGGTIRVIVTGVEGASISLDGELVVGTPPERANVPAGSHILRVTAPGRQPFSETVIVEVGRQITREITAQNLPVAQVTGRIAITTGAPDAHIFVDGQDMGVSPFIRQDHPAGTYSITIRATGFDEFTQRCTVSASQTCEVAATLSRTVGHGTLHVELARPVTGAMVSIDGRDPLEVGAGRDIPQVAAGTREVRVQAPGYDDFVVTVTVRENTQERVTAQLRRRRTGPNGTTLRERRTAISTFGAAPLYAGDVAVDVGAAFGEYPVFARGTVGLVQSSDFGVDVGLLIRSMGWMWEFELRGRSGLRLLNGLFSVGGELDLRAGLGFSGQNTFGLSAFAVASLHSLAPTADEDSTDFSDERERGNRAGTFAFSLRLGVDAARDNLSGMLYRGNGEVNVRIDGCNNRIDSMGMASMPNNPCELMLSNGMVLTDDARNTGGMMTMRTAAAMEERVNSGSQGILRAIAGLNVEVGVSRHFNIFAGIDRVLTSSAQGARRALYQASWFGNDSFTYIRAGLTYKF
ncbi:MAG: PEGA domain-containing protein [Deltaproteobacteria bacterium]|nr:PEGA domain-containing protein [Deltaproteobacteria bacterium]